MKTLHLAAGDAGAGSVVQALEGTCREAEVLGFADDLSCGSIDSDDPKFREAWWGEWWEPEEGNPEANAVVLAPRHHQRRAACRLVRTSFRR